MITRRIEFAHQPVNSNARIRNSFLFDLQYPNALLNIVIGNQHRNHIVLLLILEPEGVVDTDRSTQFLLVRITLSVVQSRRLAGPAVRAPITILRMRTVVLLHHLLGGGDRSPANPRSSRLFTRILVSSQSLTLNCDETISRTTCLSNLHSTTVLKRSIVNVHGTYAI